MATGVLEVRAGTRLWFDGCAWTVCEVSTGTVRLQDGSGGFRTATIGDLLESASGLDGPRGDESPVDALSSVALACLTTRQRAAVDCESALLASLLPATAGADDIDDHGDIATRLRDAAEQLGVSVGHGNLHYPRHLRTFSTSSACHSPCAQAATGKERYTPTSFVPAASTTASQSRSHRS